MRIRILFLFEIIFLFFLCCIYNTQPAISSTCNINNICWSKKNTLFTERRDFGSTTDINGNIYIVGGFDGNNFLSSFEKYNPISNIIEQKKPMPIPVNAMGFVYDKYHNKFYVAGGYNNGYYNNFFEYDPVLDTWSEKAPMHKPRAYLGLTVANNTKLYAIGGQDESGNALADVEEYDFLKNEWTEKTPMPTPRTGLEIISNNNEIYAIGGHADFTLNNIALGSFESFNYQSNTWITRAKLSIPRSGFGLVKSNNNLIVIGGLSNAGLNSSTEIYDEKLDKWNLVNNFPENIYSPESQIVNNKIYILGGQTEFFPANKFIYEGDFGKNINLQVPLLKQDDVRWANDIYDSAKNWSNHTTIADWGCALTSYVMSLNYYGYNLLPSGETLNPKSLNLWLKKEPNGYLDGVKSGYVNPQKIAKLSLEAKEINRINNFDMLEYSHEARAEANLVIEDLEHNIPDILELNGHYVIATGIDNNTILINDPFYKKFNLKEGYNNQIISINRLSPANSDLSFIIIFSNSENINLSLSDLEGNVNEETLQNPIINPYNNEESGKKARMIYLSKPQTGKYFLNINSSKDNLYKLRILTYDKYGNEKDKDIIGFAGKNEKDKILINFNKNSFRNTQINDKKNNFIHDLTICHKLKKISDNIFKKIKNASRNQIKHALINEKMDINEEIRQFLLSTLN